jgi:hypothetical protein
MDHASILQRSGGLHEGRNIEAIMKKWSYKDVIYKYLM